MKPRILIAGPGRAGTTFLVQVLTELGADTGYRSADDPAFRRDVLAGMERHPRPGDDPTQWNSLPLVVKDPRLSLCLGELVDAGFAVRAVVAPVRDLRGAALSRRQCGLEWYFDRENFEELVDRLATIRIVTNAEIRGNSVEVAATTIQREKLAEALGELVAAAIVRGIPLRLPRFEDVVSKPEAFRTAFAGLGLFPDFDWRLDAVRGAMSRVAKLYGREP